MMIRLSILVGLVIALSASGAVIFWQMEVAKAAEEEAAGIIVERHPYVTETVGVVTGSTYGILMEQAGIGGTDATNVFNAAQELYDLSNVTNRNF